MNTKNRQQDLLSVRLDRWLWGTRFFKTRALAKQAIEGGKVHLNGQRTKPGRAISCGETLTIRRGHDLYTVEVLGLTEKRGPAKVAQSLYQESEDSRIAREKAAEMRRIQQLSESPPSHRPDKRQRRKIHQFKQSRQ